MIVVSRSDLLHGLANDVIGRHERGAASDRAAIRAEVVDALRHQMLLGSRVINVTVNDGVVELWAWSKTTISEKLPPTRCRV